MPVLFTCPHCSAQTLVDDCYLGASGPCATCGKAITVAAEDKALTSRQRPPSAGLTNRGVRLVLAGLFIASLLGSLFLWAFLTLVWPEMQRAERVSMKQKTRDNLAMIGAALKAYHDAYECFPPAITRDAAGQPMHSWRVLILPFLGEQPLYESYHMDESWNGPNNSLLLQSMPGVFGDPSDRESFQAGETLFLAICGDGSAFPRDGVVHKMEIYDGEADTALVAESAKCTVPWMEPVDLQITRMNFTINEGYNGNSMATNQGGGPMVLLADGTVKELRADASATQLRGIVTIQGGETIHWNAIAE